MNKKMFILNSQKDNIGFTRLMESGQNIEMTLHLKNFSDKNCIPALLTDKGETQFKRKTKNKFFFDKPNNSEIKGVVLKKNDEIVAWSGEKELVSIPENITNEKNEPQKITFENFFGGGFAWQRIRGNFIVHNYSIIHHILSQKNVYEMINQSGYYTVGCKESGDLKMIALAFPITKNSSNPFESLNAETYIIHSEKTDYYALCVGIDKTGEFFLTH